MVPRFVSRVMALIVCETEQHRRIQHFHIHGFICRNHSWNKSKWICITRLLESQTVPAGLAEQQYWWVAGCLHLTSFIDNKIPPVLKSQFQKEKCFTSPIYWLPCFCVVPSFSTNHSAHQHTTRKWKQGLCSVPPKVYSWLAWRENLILIAVFLPALIPVLLPSYHMMWVWHFAILVNSAERTGNGKTDIISRRIDILCINPDIAGVIGVGGGDLCCSCRDKYLASVRQRHFPARGIWYSTGNFFL